jgi:hypothetical protein
MNLLLSTAGRGHSDDSSGSDHDSAPPGIEELVSEFASFTDPSSLRRLQRIDALRSIQT